MQSNYSRVQKAGLGLAAISYDDPAVLAAFAARRGITFPLLSDAGSKIIRSYGILNTSVEKGSAVDGIPNPGIYVLDSKGKVKAKYFEDDYKERQTAAAILLREFGMEPAASHNSVKGKHLSLGLSASSAEARMGRHVSLLLDVDLPARVHVYAPGVKGYIPIEWKQDDSSAVKTGAVEYPAARTLFLEAIQEKVPVFQGHFRLSREIVLGSDKDLSAMADKDGNLKLRGTLRYQACDDEKCFLPETVPVSWDFRFEPLDRVRAK